MKKYIISDTCIKKEYKGLGFDNVSLDDVVASKQQVLHLPLLIP